MRIAVLILAGGVFTATPAAAQHKSFETWEDVFAHGFDTADEAAAAHSHRDYLEKCHVATPEWITVMPFDHSTREPTTNITWEPEINVKDDASSYTSRYGSRVYRSPGAEPLDARAAGTWCNQLASDPAMLVAVVLELRGKYALVTVKPDLNRHMMILHSRGSELRWSAVHHALESMDEARKRWGAKGWSSRAIEAVLARRIYIGMTEEMVRESWGEPEDINRTMTARAVHEQWVYGLGRYAYVDDGRLTAIQN